VRNKERGIYLDRMKQKKVGSRVKIDYNKNKKGKNTFAA
jgi:DNA primase